MRFRIALASLLALCLVECSHASHASHAPASTPSPRLGPPYSFASAQPAAPREFADLSCNPSYADQRSVGVALATQEKAFEDKGDSYGAIRFLKRSLSSLATYAASCSVNPDDPELALFKAQVEMRLIREYKAVGDAANQGEVAGEVSVDMQHIAEDPNASPQQIAQARDVLRSIAAQAPQ